jgi:hypothetical protein
MDDPGIPTIPCLIDALKFDRDLSDLGVRVSAMPKVIYDKLNHNYLVPTSMHLQLADQSTRRLIRIAKDIPLKIRNSFIPIDFVVLEMDVCQQTPLILGRQFLSTAERLLTSQLGSYDWTSVGKRRHSHVSQKG